MKRHALTPAALITALIFIGLPAAFSHAGRSSDAQRATATTLPAATAGSPSSRHGSPDVIARGRYLVQITGCNDCHTAGYAQRGGKVPASEWLTGVPVGFKGPWGTSYPSNLRLTVQSLTEDQWLQFARAERLPPMPWFALQDMSDADLRAMYQFIRSLGAKGERAPAAVAPGRSVSTPFMVWEVQVEAANVRTTAANR